MHRSIPVVTAAIALTGCSLAPGFIQPAAPIYSTYVAPASGSTSATELGWRDFFGDPQLETYLDAALTNNRDLAASAARIAQARAQFRIQHADRLPQLDVNGSAVRTRTPFAAPGAVGPDGVPGEPQAVTSNQYAVQVAVSAFELDFWGRVYNLSESARRQYFATIEADRAFRLSLISDVAAAYYSVRAGEEGIALAERVLVARREGLEIADLRLEAGVTSTVDYDQSAVLVAQAETELADLRRTTEQQRNQLLVLVGGPVLGPLPAGRPIDDAGQFRDLDAGLPSSLLTDRPDVLQAEQALRAADADIGAARAALFPTLSLTGDFGFVSSALDALLDDDGRAWSFGGAVSLPLFDGGRRRADVSRTQARRDELVADYQRTVQVAFQEVSDALVGRQRFREQIQAQERAVAAQRRLAETAELRYQNGISIYLEVLDAQRNLFVAEQALIQLRATELQNGVSLFTALGGGLIPRSQQ